MIDWIGITNRIRAKQGSLENVARDLNMCPVHLRRLSRGEVNEPKFSAGIKLLDLHLDLYPVQHEEINL